MLDPKGYRDSVVLPLSKDPARQQALADAQRALNLAADGGGTAELQQILASVDATSLLAITPGMSDADLKKHLASLEMFVNKSRLPIVQQIGRFLTVTRRKLGDSYASAAFWNSIGEAAGRAAEGQLRSFAEAVRQETPLGVITLDRARTAARAHGIPAGVSDAALSSALQAQEVAVCPEVVDPQVPLTENPLKRGLSSDYRSIVDVMLLHEQQRPPAEIRVIDELSAVVGGARRGIGTADLTRSRAAADANAKYAGGGGQLTLTVLHQRCPNDADLHRLALSWFIARADELLRVQGLMARPALERLRKDGLAELDARRLLTSVVTRRAQGPGIAQVLELVADGRLGEAERLFTVLSAQSEADRSEQQHQVATALQEARRAKERALAAFRAAQAAHDAAATEQALRAALAIDADDAVLQETLDRLAPPAPEGLTAAAAPGGSGVSLSWRTAPDESITYTAVRSTRGVPAAPQAGRVLGTPDRTGTATDADAPVAQELTYAVFASRPGSAHSEPATAQITLLPPPSSVDVSTSEHEVALHWTTPREATGVTVETISADGTRTSLPVTTGSSARITGLRLGTRYTFSLTAHYLVDGRPARSQRLSVTATPRGAARAVGDLRATARTGAHGASLTRLEWTEAEGYSTEIWALPLTSDVSSLTTTTEDELRRLDGHRLTGALRTTGRRATLECGTPATVVQLVPVTWQNETGLVGTPRVGGAVPAPERLHLVRLGSEVLATWEWPEGQFEMEATWSAGTRQLGHRRLTPLSYRQAGGLRIRDAEEVTRVSVATVLPGAPPGSGAGTASATLDPAGVRISYTLKLPRARFGGRRATATFTGPASAGPVELAAVMSLSPFMPSTADEGNEIAALTLDLSGTGTCTHTFDVPRARGPYWVRIFARDPGRIDLVDPLTSSLKG